MSQKLIKEYVLDDETGQTNPVVHRPREPHFARVYQEAKLVMRQQHVFSQAERDLLDGLEGCVELGSNALADHGHAYSLREIAKLIALDESQVSRHMRELIRKNAVARVEQGDGKMYFINPALFMAGPVNPWVIDLFREGLRYRLKEGAKAIRHGRHTYPIVQFPSAFANN